MIKITKNKTKRAVYDITVKDNHNFFANNILVHNCTEITLHSKPTSFEHNNDRRIKEYGETAVCNLGSVILSSHIVVVNGAPTIDWELLADTIVTGARMLDNVIDINFYPTQEAKLSNTRHRPVGMGSMGWHDLFYALDINYDSDEATKVSDELYEFMSMCSIKASALLAKERGAYSTYKGSLWDQGIFPIDTYNKLSSARADNTLMPIAKENLEEWKTVRELVNQYGMRNSNTMAIAPTATISIIVGCSSCTEPYYNPIYVSSTLSGDFTVVCEPLVNDLKKLNLWSHNMLNDLKRNNGDLTQIHFTDEAQKAYLCAKYKTAFQQDQFKLLEAAAARGKWIDQAMSVNLFNDRTSLKYLSDLYIKAWMLGLKTTYYLRNKGASDIEKASVSAKSVEPIVSSIGDQDLPVKACLINDPGCESCQ